MVLRLCWGFALLLAGCMPVAAQYHAVKLNTTFILHNRAMGGFGFEFCPDSSRFTYGINVEVGQYKVVENTAGSSSITTEQVVGVGLMPEVRQYLPWFGREKPLGAFVSGFGRIRMLRNEREGNVRSGTAGFQFEDTRRTVGRSVTLDGGLGLGYKTGKCKTGLQAEVVAGLGWSYDTGRSFTDGSRYFRFDLFLCGLFARKPATDDFVW